MATKAAVIEGGWLLEPAEPDRTIEGGWLLEAEPPEPGLHLFPRTAPEPQRVPFREHVAAQPLPAYGGPAATVPPTRFEVSGPPIRPEAVAAPPPIVPPMVMRTKREEPEVPVKIGGVSVVKPEIVSEALKPKTPEEAIESVVGAVPQIPSRAAAGLAPLIQGREPERPEEVIAAAPPREANLLERSLSALGLLEPKEAEPRRAGRVMADIGQGRIEPPTRLGRALAPGVRIAGQVPTGVVESATLGLLPALMRAYGLRVPEAETALEQVARGFGGLVGFIKGPAVAAGRAAFEGFLAPLAKDAVGKILAKQIAHEAAVLASASALSQTGRALEQPTKIGAVVEIGHGAASGAIMGTVFAGVPGVITGETLAQTAARAGLGIAALDLAEGRRPWDERDLAQKAFDYGLDAYFLFRGRDPKALQAHLRRAAEATGTMPEQVLRLAFYQNEADRGLRMQMEVALEKARTLGFARPEAAVAQEEAIRPQAEAELVQRGIAVPEATEALRRAPEPTPQAPVDEQGRPVAPTAPTLESTGPLRTAREIERAINERLVGELNIARYQDVPSSFYEFTRERGRWPITSTDPGYMALRREWDELRRPLYEVQGPRLGQWDIVNRVSKEVEAQAPNRAMAQLQANRLDAARMRPMRPEQADRFNLPIVTPRVTPEITPEPQQEAAPPVAESLRTSQKKPSLAGQPQAPVAPERQKGAKIAPAEPKAEAAAPRAEIEAEELRNLPENVKVRRISAMTGMSEAEATRLVQRPAEVEGERAERDVAEFQMAARDYFEAAPDEPAAPEVLNRPHFERFGGLERVTRDLFNGDRDLMAATLEMAKRDVVEGRVQEKPLFTERERVRPIGGGSGETEIARFIGYQEAPEREPLALYNLKQAIGERPIGDTVSAVTLRESGAEVPDTPTFEQWQRERAATAETESKMSQLARRIKDIFTSEVGAIRFGGGQAKPATPVPDPALLRDLAEYGQEVRRTRLDYEAWAEAMRKEFGERVEPHLRPAWEEMRRGPRAVIEPAAPPPTPPPTGRGAAPMPSGRPGVLQDIDAMAREPEKLPWKERLRKAKERVIETQVNRFEPVRRLTSELKKLGERGLAQPTGTIEPIESMEIAKNRMMGQSQLFGGRLEGIIKSAANIGLEDHLNRYLTLAQFDKRIRDLAARPESDVTPEGRTKDGGYVNPRQFDAAKVQAGFAELREQTGERWPELEQLAKRVWTMNRDLLTQARDVGLVGQEAYDAIIGRGEDYVPMQVLDYLDEVGSAGASPRPFDVRYQDVLRRMEGTERDVRNALASTFDKGMRVIATINRNKAARAVTDLATSLPGIVDEVPGDQFKVAGDRDVVSAFYDGHRKNFAVPTDIARAMKFLDAEQLGLVGRILMVGKRPLQIGATGANLAFAIPNVIRDMKRAAIYSKYGVNTPADLMIFAQDWVRGLAHVYRQDAVYEEFLRSGAAFSTIQKLLTPEAFLSAARGEKPLADRLNLIKAGIESVQKLNSMLEETTKLATFQRGLRAGAPIDQVAYEVANYGGSPNFGRAGSWGMHLNLIWMFYNARLQGTAANLRRIRETPARAGKAALVRLGVLASIPTLALWAWNQQFDDDDGMEQISDGDRQRYHIILLPETYRSSTGEMRRKYLKIVKEESEQIISAPLTGFLDYWKGQHPQSVADLAAEVLSAVSPLGVNLVGEPNANNLVRAAASGVLGSANPLLRVPVELGANYHAFYQGPIVPKSLAEHVRPTEQVRPTTSPTIAAIAQAMDRLPGAEALGLTSPIKLQHAVASSTGGLGQTTLDATDVILAAAAKHLDVELGFGLRPGVPETVPAYERVGRQALVSRFVGTSGQREDRDAERRLYEALDQARRARGSIKLVEKREGRKAGQEIKKEEGPYVEARAMLENIARQLGDNYKRQITATYYSTAPLHEREQKLRELAETRHRLMDRFRRREAETSRFTHTRRGEE